MGLFTKLAALEKDGVQVGCCAAALELEEYSFWKFILLSPFSITVTFVKYAQFASRLLPLLCPMATLVPLSNSALVLKSTSEISCRLYGMPNGRGVSLVSCGLLM